MLKEMQSSDNHNGPNILPYNTAGRPRIVMGASTLI